MDRLPGIGEKAEESQNQQERKGDLGAGSSGLRDKDPGHPILEMDMLKDNHAHTGPGQDDSISARGCLKLSY